MCAEQDASYIVMHHTSCKCRREGNANMCVREPESPGRMEWERADRGEGESEGSEKEMTSPRKCWAGFKGSWMKEVYSHSAPSLSLSPSFFLSHEMYSAGRVPIPTWLVNGRGVEYFKQRFTLLLFPSILLSPFFFLFGCALVKCTHDPVSATAVHA